MNPIGIAAAIQTAALFLVPSTLQSQSVVESDSAALVLRMEASQTSYRTGDTIRIRITLRNTTADTVAVRSSAQFFPLTLRIFDGAGRQLPESHGPATFRLFSGPPMWYLGPWREFSFPGFHGEEWLPLNDWGYDLRRAGGYEIHVPFAEEVPYLPPLTVTVLTSGMKETPLITLIALVVGIVLASAFLFWTRSQPDAGRRLYTIGLVVTPLIYFVFALAGRAGARSLALEAAGVLLYGAAAWIGYRWSATVLALGWALHVVWDVALHLQGAGALYTPDWYPWGCASFDLMVGGAVLAAGLKIEGHIGG